MSECDPRAKASRLLSAVDADWPLFGLCDDVRPALGEMLACGARGALATLVRVDGPSPRPVGAQMLIGAEGDAAGYVSGGCVEANLALLGREVAQSGERRRVVFGAGSPFFDIRLVCGARIDVFVEPIDPSDESLAAVLRAQAQRRAVTRWVALKEQPWTRDSAAGEAMAGVDQTGAIWRRYQPATRLVLIGGDPIVLASAALAASLGWDVVLVRPRGPAASPDFGLTACSVRYLALSPREALARIGLDPWTAVVAMSHDLEEDHQALALALASPAFYVGALGSRRRLEDRRALLRQAGLHADAMNRLHAPVGLDIGAGTSSEIALSIVTGVVAALRKGGGG